MPTEILMPALSPTMEEGTLAKWLVKEGDTVSSGDLLAEIETDKATMEFEAVDEGTIGKLLVSEGSEGVKVNTPIAVILEEGESADAVDDASAPEAPAKASGEAPDSDDKDKKDRTRETDDTDRKDDGADIAASAKPAPPRPRPTTETAFSPHRWPADLLPTRGSRCRTCPDRARMVASSRPMWRPRAPRRPQDRTPSTRKKPPPQLRQPPPRRPPGRAPMPFSRCTRADRSRRSNSTGCARRSPPA